MNKLENLKVAIVYDRVNKWGGAERVLLALHEIFPKASLYTSVYDPENAPWAKVFPEVKTSFLQKFPFANKVHEFLAVFMPIAFESFDFDEFDLVVSVTSEFAKGVITKPDTYHLCYCLTPTRYLWSGYKQYFKNPLLKLISYPFVFYLKSWDKIASKRPDKMIAISKEVKKRIKKYYDLDSEVIYPPVKLKNESFKATLKKKTGYFLVVSRLVGYKRVDLVVKAFNKLRLPLIVVGKGWRAWGLKFLANKNITFLDSVEESELYSLFHGARALVMPQKEDFGLVSVEAQSVGTPVIAFGSGGATETIVNGKTGVLFKDQSVRSLLDAIAKFDKMRFNHRYIRQNAEKFKEDFFKKRIQEALVRVDFSRWRRNQALADVQKQNSKTVSKTLQ